MKVIDSGHYYLLNSLDGGLPVALYFVKREGPGYPGNKGTQPGTNMQEVLRALIERSEYLNRQIPCAETEAVIHHLRSSLLLLELRAARRHGRVLAIHSYEDIETMETCSKCGHIGCGGDCHE
jgi:hypothetical protein